MFKQFLNCVFITVKLLCIHARLLRFPTIVLYCIVLYSLTLFRSPLHSIAKRCCFSWST